MEPHWVISMGVHDRYTELHRFAHADLERRLQSVNPPGWFHCRDGTTDLHVLDSVDQHNEYRLPDAISPEHVVVDIGAHVGGFAYAAWRRGCRSVYAFEANASNFAALKANAARMPGVEARHAAVWSSTGAAVRCQLDAKAAGNPSRSVWYKVGPLDAGDYCESEPVESISLDDIILSLGGRRVAFLKLDCEGAEFPILLSCQSLSLVDRVAAEVHGDPTPLVECLASWGFVVGVEPAADHPDSLALLFAQRPPCSV